MAQATTLNTATEDKRKTLGVVRQLQEVSRKSQVNQGKVVTQI